MTGQLESIVGRALAPDWRDLLASQRHPDLWEEALDCNLRAGLDKGILRWLTGPVGLDLVQVAAFWLGVARISVDARTGLWSPVARDDAEDGGQPAITMPVMTQPGDWDSTIDIVAFDPDDLGRFWLRSGHADLLGEAALHWAVLQGKPLRVYPTPRAWMRGWCEAREAWLPERRSAEDECRAMALKAARENDRLGWKGLAWADTTLRVWFEQRVPPMPVAGSQGVCVLNGSLSLEMTFADVPALIADGPEHAEAIAERMAADRRRRRAAERMPKVGFVRSAGRRPEAA